MQLEGARLLEIGQQGRERIESLLPSVDSEQPLGIGPIAENLHVLCERAVNDIGAPLVLYEKEIEGVRFVAAMEVRKGRKMLALKTFYKGRP